MTERELTKLLNLCAPDLTDQDVAVFIVHRQRRELNLDACKKVLCFNPDDAGLKLKEAHVTTAGIQMYFSKEGYGPIGITSHCHYSLGLFNYVLIEPLVWSSGNTAIRGYKVTNLTSLKQKIKLHDKRFNK